MPTVVEVVSLLAAVVATWTGVLVLRRSRTSPLALPLAVMMFGASSWATARALLHVARASVPGTVVLHYLVFPGAAAVTAAAYWYFVVLTGRRLSRRAAVLLLVHPTLLLAVLASNPWHEAFLRVAVDGGTVQVGVGPLYWLHSAYCYVLIGAGIALALAAMVRAVPGHRHVFVVAALAATVPAVGNVLTTLLAARPERPHLTPVFFLVSAAIWSWVERFGGHSATVPVSTRQVLEVLDDAVVVLDPRGRVLDANPAAHALLGDLQGVRLQEDGEALPRPARVAIDALRSGPGTLTTDSGAVLDVRVTPLTDAVGRAAGTVVVMRDVTELERLRAELVDQATRDGLTGLHNRRALEERLAAAADDAAASGRPLSVALLDVDHFKAVNDAHGHGVGDQVLAEVGRVLAESTGPGETSARLGGEEFVLLLPGLDPGAAARRAQDLRTRCAQIAVPARTGTVCVTVSAGVAALHPGGSPDDLLRTADEAMYAAKAAGRDRVACAGDPVRG
ncbi:histidine kinase N-terminal 7TM domain-containing diguanylate cyclase [Cellulomonas telluris]|uniref:histidine kinase N-terminal 7TM domain-containing diguanylate cyclase n=1 Tax=Cellulomonas telluris TaxID=2306636 RepID=UPI00145627D6|nr:diguanylate cyclase [Cellulomonas telluris]